MLDLSAVEARAALDAKSISATELTTAYIAAAEETAALNNYVLLTPDHALAMAAKADARLAKGAGLICRPHGEFITVQLADHHRTGVPQIGCYGALIWRGEPVQNARTCGCLHPVCAK